MVQKFAKYWKLIRLFVTLTNAKFIFIQKFQLEKMKWQIHENQIAFDIIIWVPEVGIKCYF